MRDQSSSLLDTAAATAESLSSELSTTIDGASELMRAAGKLADQHVRQRPWQTAAVALAMGALIGFCSRGR